MANRFCGSRTILRLGSILLLAACQAPNPQEPSGNSHRIRVASAQRPFRATFIITPQILFPGEAGYPARCPAGAANAAAIATGEGHGLHLGALSESESGCVDFATLLLTLGELTLTAANGDQVFMEWQGAASFDPPPPNANLACEWTILGGTGRFTSATGRGTCMDSRQLGDGRSSITLEGWIQYDASDRRAR